MRSPTDPAQTPDGPVTPADRALPLVNCPGAGEPDAWRRIRRAQAQAGRRIAVLDDDPTGSQTVHDPEHHP
jgi:hypothetical protein